MEIENEILLHHDCGSYGSQWVDENLRKMNGFEESLNNKNLLELI